MKKLLLLIILVLLIFAPVVTKEITNKEFKVRKGERLDVNLKSGGSIKVTGWDRNLAKIVVSAHSNHDYYDVICKKTPSGVKVESRYGKGRSHKNGGVSVDIYVPEKFDIQVRTSGGSIQVKHIKGDIQGKTMGGSLKLTHLQGKIDLTTMGGSVSLTDSDVDGRLKTMGGRVMLENVIGDVKGSSMGGSVLYKNVTRRSGKTTGKAVQISTMGGAINVEDAANGAHVHTRGGKIHIKSAKVFVKAKTMGGNIFIDEIDGWVKATTMGGKVKVNMVGDPQKGKRDVILTSMGGDIQLKVPAGLAMGIEIELAYTKSSMREYKIVSDFNIQQKRTDEWQHDKGSPRKYIYGKGKTGDGKHKIIIKTINGNVILKKGK